MAHKTTPEENYSGLTEEGFEAWTVDWNEFFDFISEHNGEKIDVTIDKNSLEDAEEYFADSIEDESRFGDFLSEIEELEIAEGTLVLRLPDGLKHMGYNAWGYESGIPDCIAKIYIPPTFYAAIDIDIEKFVVPSNYTYKIGHGEKDYSHCYGTVIYNTDTEDSEKKCKTYETNVKHFPAGKYVACISGEKYQKELYYINGDCDEDYSEQDAASDLIDGNDDCFSGIDVGSAVLIIKNVTTGQVWKLSNENENADTSAGLWDEDEIMPCYKMDQLTFDPTNYYTATEKWLIWELGEAITEDDVDNYDENCRAVDFPEGFNYGDIRLAGCVVSEIGFFSIAFYGIKDESCDCDFSDGYSNFDEIHVAGEEYTKEELEDLQG